MITINIRYSADSNTMRIDDISNKRIAGTTGDDNATHLNFHFDDADGTLDGFGVRVEFDVIVDDDLPYKPYMILDESMSIRIPNAIMSRVRYGSLPIQLAFSRIDSENSDEVVFYSLNKLVLSVADAIMSSATEPIDIERHPDLMDAIYSVRYDDTTSSFYFTQFDGSQIKVHLSDLSEEHFEVENESQLILLNNAEDGDTATTLDNGKWYKLYGLYSDINNWKLMSSFRYGYSLVNELSKIVLKDADGEPLSEVPIDDTPTDESPNLISSDAVYQSISTERSERQSADATLQSNIDTEIANRTSADTTISTNLSNHINDKTNPHTVTKAQVGLGNVDNTSDADKPISTATQNALNLKADKSEISFLYRPKGSVATYNDLPPTAQIGDVYDVQSTGMNYVWTGSRWDELGAIIDLSPYYTKTEVDGALGGKVSKSGDTMTGGLTLPSTILKSSSLATPYIDFNYNNADTFTTRMIQLDGEFRITGSSIVTLGVTKPDSADNSTKIATTSWISTADCIFHTIGNENVAGIKSYNDEICMKSRTEYNDATYQTSSNFTFRQGSQFTGSIKTVHDESNDNSIAIETKNPTTGKNATLRVISKADGTSEMRLISDGVWNKIATEGWSNDAFVKKTGDTMTGNLYIRRVCPSFVMKSDDKDVVVSNGFGSYKNISEYKVNDYNDTNIMNIRTDADVTYTRYFIALKNYVNGVATDRRFDFYNYSDGTSALMLPQSPSSNENSRKVATTEWVNTASSVVHKTENETVSGGKSFTSIFHIKSTNIANAEPPSSDLVGTRIQFVPNNATNGGYQEYLAQFVPFHYKTHTSMQIYVRRVIDGTSVNASLGIRINADGTQYVTAPTTPSNANSNEVATANWVNNKLAGKVTISTSAPTPTDGNDGDIWIQY